MDQVSSNIFEKEKDRFKVVEQSDKIGLNELDEEGEYTVKKSKLMTSYDALKSMSPEQRETEGVRSRAQGGRKAAGAEESCVPAI